MRLLTRRTQLWTEMLVDTTILHTRYLDELMVFEEDQHPLVCQLGGSNPETLAQAAEVVQRYGYDEVNLNCGCPSDKVSVRMLPRAARTCGVAPDSDV